MKNILDEKYEIIFDEFGVVLVIHYYFFILRVKLGCVNLVGFFFLIYE